MEERDLTDTFKLQSVRGHGEQGVDFYPGSQKYEFMVTSSNVLWNHLLCINQCSLFTHLNHIVVKNIFWQYCNKCIFKGADKTSML